MKKISLLLVLVMVISLVFSACDTSTPAATENPVSSGTATTPSTTEPAKSEAPEASETPKTPENPVIRLSTTTSVNDSGLLPYLQPHFEKETGYKLEITSNGTGAAIKLGETGDADCLLVHAKASEDAFITAGFGVERIPFMYNYFVILGPEADPAGVAASGNATAAFKAIANEATAGFVSRGDDSGTNKAELNIWKAAGIEPKDDWYISAGAGMGATLNQANERLDYTFSDKATYLSNKKNLDLKILLEQSDELKNTYSMIAVSPEKWPDTNIDGANAFIEWMQKEETLALIAKYGVEEYGEALFFVGK